MQQPILILGAGINGAALAREFLLNQVGVCLVDSADVASGTTAYSSRLIHGGLRYLEHGEFSLVRESLAERRHLLTAAPQFVRPLRLCIPVRTRGEGLARAVTQLLGIAGRRRVRRGLWLVQLGLWLYDTYAGTDRLERRATHRAGEAGIPRIDPQYSWLCSYTDAQIAFPERLVIAMLRDCQRLADQNAVPFQLFTYRHATRRGETVEVADADGRVEAELRPAAIVNATGAWVDRTLQRLNVSSPRLVGGTKGSHLLTYSASLRDALAGQGVYVEAEDGRPVFVLPLGDATLIGTTDVVYDAPPETAVAGDKEIEYLLSTVNSVIPAANIKRDEIHLHYCGVRPLPFAGDTKPSAITRRHTLHEHAGVDPALFSVIGGKLTTSRALAQETVRLVMSRLGRSAEADSRQRLLPGAEGFPAAPEQLIGYQQRVAAQTGATLAQVAAVWSLCGTEARHALGVAPRETDQNLAGTQFPIRFVRRMIQDEWVVRLSDLVERRLMLLYDRKLSPATLRQLATLLAEEGVLDPDQIESEVTACRDRLAAHFGKTLDGKEGG